MSEGAAISKKSLKIAFSQTSAQNPDLPQGASRLIVADVDPVSRRLANHKVIIESPDNACTLEAQDFFDNDNRMTYTCYERAGKGSVWTIDLRTGQRVNQTQAIGSYNEVEGIFPDGLHTCVESDRAAALTGNTRLFRDIDIWKLRLDGTGKSFERLTHFNDWQGGKASNPVVSTDGKFMAFQFANTEDEAGVGYGILVYRFDKK
jgi:Tol biopolymer transport system component